MNTIKSFMAILCVSFFMISCGDDGGLTLVVTSPADGTVYSPGDIVDVRGTATDDIAVASLTFSSTELDFSQTIDAGSLPLAPFEFTITIVENSQLLDDIKIEITATDDEGNTISEERSISIQ